MLSGTYQVSTIIQLSLLHSNKNGIILAQIHKIIRVKGRERDQEQIYDKGNTFNQWKKDIYYMVLRKLTYNMD